jgi:hypothetical protein
MVKMGLLNVYGDLNRNHRRNIAKKVLVNRGIISEEAINNVNNELIKILGSYISYRNKRNVVQKSVKKNTNFANRYINKLGLVYNNNTSNEIKTEIKKAIISGTNRLINVQKGKPRPPPRLPPLIKETPNSKFKTIRNTLLNHYKVPPRNVNTTMDLKIDQLIKNHINKANTGANVAKSLINIINSKEKPGRWANIERFFYFLHELPIKQLNSTNEQKLELIQNVLKSKGWRHKNFNEEEVKQQFVDFLKIRKGRNINLNIIKNPSHNYKTSYETLLRRNRRYLETSSEFPEFIAKLLNKIMNSKSQDIVIQRRLNMLLKAYNSTNLNDYGKTLLRGQLRKNIITLGKKNNNETALTHIKGLINNATPKTFFSRFSSKSKKLKTFLGR